MRERIKYSGGPMNGKVRELAVSSSWNERVVISELQQNDRSLSMMHPDATLVVKRGEYVRSYERTKNGTPIYKWLGWYPNG